jgi:nitrite reductase/ring-hydroxylating ferredoxin subunit
MTEQPQSDDGSCANREPRCACAPTIDQSRRQFLRDAFAAVVSAPACVGMHPAHAIAMPLALTTGTHVRRAVVSFPIPSADGAQIDKPNGVILVRWQGAVYAFDLSCPHQNTALKWDDRDHSFNCPKHHSQFQPDGEYIADSGRATRNMDRFAVAKEGSEIRVDLDKLYREDTDNAQWIAALVKV